MKARVFPILIALWAASLPASGEKFRFHREMMGTRFTIVLHADESAAAEAAAEAAFSIARNAETIASDYLPESELSQISTKPTDLPVALSPQLYQWLEHSRRLAEATGGAFDPSLGPLTKLWRQTRDSKSLPDPEVLRRARAATGWRNFSLDPQARAITLRQQNMAFDLGGVAKGYVADLMLESLVAAGISRAMIAAGGDIRVGAPPPGRDGWRIALQTFDLKGTDEVITLANAAVSTSGDLHQSVEIDGVRYSHILDPSTGLGLTRRIAVSVIASEAKLSDPLATAACVLGPDACDVVRNFPGVREVKIRTMQATMGSPRLATPSH